MERDYAGEESREDHEASMSDEEDLGCHQMCDVEGSAGCGWDNGSKLSGKSGAGSWPGHCMGDLGRRESDLGYGVPMRIENCVLFVCLFWLYKR